METLLRSYAIELFELLDEKEDLTETERVMHGAISDYLDELETLETNTNVD